MAKLPLIVLILLSSFIPYSIAEPLVIRTGLEEKSKAFRIAQSFANELGTRAGTSITLLSLPEERGLNYLQAGMIDGDLSRTSGLEHDMTGLIRINELIFDLPYIAYCIKKGVTVNGWTSLYPYSVAYVRGWEVIANKLKPNHKKLFRVDSVEAGLNFMALERADVFVSIPFLVEPLLKQEEWKNRGVVALEPPLDVLSLYLYLLPKHAQLAKNIEVSLKAMKQDNSYYEILNGSGF